MSAFIKNLFFQSKEKSIPDKNKRTENIIAFFVCALISCVFLLVCTRSSPLYPFNDWVDANCFFTVGKSMMHGRVLYRDIYEQKGILLYLIHGIAYLISNTTFLGVYIFEVISFTFFLYLSYLIARLYVNYLLSLSILPVMSWAVLTSVSLRQGDSAEEFCLPFILFCIYAMLKNTKEGDGTGIPSLLTTYFLGVCAGCILWIKYTMLGIYIGYVIVVVMLCIVDRDMYRLMRSAAAFVLGAMTVSLPVFLYFALNGATSDLFEAYFYNNMFLYTDERSFAQRWSDIFSLAFRGLNNNKLWGWLCYLGLFSLVSDVENPRASFGGIMMYLGNIFFIYWGGIGWYYYSFGMVALCVPGFVASVRIISFVCSAGYLLLRKLISLVRARLGERANARLDRAKSSLTELFDQKSRASISLICALCVCMSLYVVYFERCYSECDNVFYMKQSREEIWQTKFAEIIAESEDQTLLNYSCLDLGLYTTAHIIPTEKYFCRLNLNTDEMNESLDSAVSEGRVEFLVIRGNPSDFVKTYYEIVASEKSHVEYEGSSTTYHLMRRK